MKVVTVYSDGTPSGTRVVDEDGNTISNIFEAEVWLDAKDVPRLTIHMHPVSLNIKNAIIKGAEFHCPGCSKVHSHECK